MFLNRINPIKFFGILILSIPALLFGVLIQEFMDFEYGVGIDPVYFVLAIAMIFGLLTSFSLFLNWKYSRLLTNILLTIILIIVSFTVYKEIRYISIYEFGVIFLIMFIYLALLFCFIFINNQFMQAYFKADFFVKEDYMENLLDSKF